MNATAEHRELAYREANGVRVCLLWFPDTGETIVTVSTDAGDASFPVAAAHALDGFYHPAACMPAESVTTVFPSRLASV